MKSVQIPRVVASNASETATKASINTNYETTFTDPACDENFYRNIERMMANGAMTTKTASKLITDEIFHRVISLAHEDECSAFILDNQKDLEQYVFEDIRSMIRLHLETFVRYKLANIQNKKYCAMYEISKHIIDRANEYFDFGLDYEDFKSELDAFYQVFQ